MKLGLADKAAIASAMCRDDRLSGDQCRVGCALLFTFHNTGTGKCFPSYRQLAEASRTSQGTVLRAIKALEGCGYIEVERSNGGRNQRNRYAIKCSASGAFSEENTPPVEQKHSTSGAPCSASGARNTPLVIDAYNTGIKTQELNTGIKHSGRLPKEELLSVLDADRVNAVIEHRRALKKQLTPRAARLLAARLAACPDPNAAADEMILRGWLSIKPEWLDNRRRGSDPVGTFARHKTP